MLFGLKWSDCKEVFCLVLRWLGLFDFLIREVFFSVSGRGLVGFGVGFV